MNLNNVVIFGDSYSTFEGHIPEGYFPYYSASEDSETDVRKVSETWWYQLMQETNSNLLLNNSWSGSTICYTGWGHVDCSETSSFIYRLKELTESGYFKENKVDTVFVLGGTNDSWCEAPLGESKYADWKKEDLYSVLPAIPYFFKNLKEALPEANIICIINSELKPEITEGMKAACEYYGIPSIQLKNVDKVWGHPTIEGMKNIKDQVLAYLNQ